MLLSKKKKPKPNQHHIARLYGYENLNLGINTQQVSQKEARVDLFFFSFFFLAAPSVRRLVLSIIYLPLYKVLFSFTGIHLRKITWLSEDEEQILHFGLS